MVKSDASLSRLYSHMRHPSFSAIALVLLARPSMTLDRYFNLASLGHDFSQGSAGRCADQLHVPSVESRPRGPPISGSSVAKKENNTEGFIIGPGQPIFITVP